MSRHFPDGPACNRPGASDAPACIVSRFSVSRQLSSDVDSAAGNMGGTFGFREAWGRGGGLAALLASYADSLVV
jgi:hypothetical protein